MRPSNRLATLPVALIAIVALSGVTPAAAAARLVEAQPAGARLGATGYFHLARANGREWLVDPAGLPYYSSGMNHVSSSPDVDQTTGDCPYCDAVAADYPDLDAWSAAQIARLRSWGFNTLASWSDGTPALRTQMPYTVLLSMASGDDWFSPSFVAHARQVASTLTQYADDPNLLGYFTDSELHWGPDWRSDQPVLDDYLALPPGSPGRTVADQHVGDPDGFLYVLARRYFSVTTAAIRRYDPNHLVLGVKAVAQLIQPQLLEAARPYVDVWSVDDYQLLPSISSLITSLWPFYLPDTPGLAAIERIVKRPIIVGEYSYRAADSGLPNSWPPIFPTFATQTDRANQLRAYDQALYATPWIVGDDWFEYVDEPIHGRTGDGENSDWGVLSTADQPYTALTDTMAEVHAGAPGRTVRGTTRCLSWVPGTAGHPRCDVR